jgi:hypothetical protein
MDTAAPVGAWPLGKVRLPNCLGANGRQAPVGQGCTTWGKRSIVGWRDLMAAGSTDDSGTRLEHP